MTRQIYGEFPYFLAGSRPMSLNRKRKPRRSLSPAKVVAEIIDRPAVVSKRQLRDPHPEDPALLDRQIQVFELSANGYSLAAIARTLNIPRATAHIDLLAEFRRRYDERINDKAFQLERAMTALNLIMARSIGRITNITAKAARAEGVDLRTFAALMSAAAREERNVLAARKEMNLLLKLTEPESININIMTEEDTALINLLASLPEEQRIRIRTKAALLEQQQRGMRNVTPASKPSEG
jgi:DNA-binding CsgD family transcriptional regulator